MEPAQCDISKECEWFRRSRLARLRVAYTGAGEQSESPLDLLLVHSMVAPSLLVFVLFASLGEAAVYTTNAAAAVPNIQDLGSAW
jgi:hypothetical protein